MKIQFTCDSCGKSYSVKQELAGKKAKCKDCGHQIRIPDAAPASHSIPSAAPKAAPPVATHAPANTPRPGVTGTEGLESKFMNAYPVGDAAKTLDSAQPPDFSHAMGGTMASNPGNIRVSKFRYIRVYPKWFMIWHGLALISILLCIYSLWFIPLALFFVFCVWFYWHRIKSQFMHGCTNPSQVISISPGLIATYTDLTKGINEYPIIRISEQPIHKMSTGAPAVGQKIATVALYEDRFPENEHWSSFDPKPVACVTGNQNQISRVMGSIEKEDWDFLQRGLAQVPKPLKPGHYRIYEKADLTNGETPEPGEIRQVVCGMLSDKKYVHLASEFSGINAEQMKEAAAYIPANQQASVWCLVEAMTISGGCKYGIAFTNTGIIFNFKECGKGQIPYASIAGGFSSNDGLELLLRDGKRIYFTDGNFMNELLGVLDIIFNYVGGKVD